MEINQLKSIVEKYSQVLKSLGVTSSKIDMTKHVHVDLDQDKREVYNHLVYMCDSMLATIESDPAVNFEKMNRWLGFIQGSLFCLGLFSIDDLKNQNR